LTKQLMATTLPRNMTFSDLRLEAELAGKLLRKALDAFARLDTTSAKEILRDDKLIDAEFEGFTRKLITYVMEDPRTISAALDLLFVAKAIERIGDHAKNIAELVIYIAEGTDVRHTSVAEQTA
jgi:phosphate transport system protein